MIEIVVSGAEAAEARLAALPQEAKAGLARAIAKFGFDLQRTVQADKLSGQVLQVRSGVLRSSIATTIADGGESVSATVGTRVWYGKLHEYGLKALTGHDRIYPVRAKALRFEIGGRVLFRKSVRGAPERSFLRSALAEMAPELAPRVAEAVAEAMAR